MTDLLLPTLGSDDATTSPFGTTPPVVGWQIANSASPSEVEDLLDSLENQGVAEREVTFQSDRFAVRWQ